jgi:hypothetical protein
MMGSWWLGLTNASLAYVLCLLGEAYGRMSIADYEAELVFCTELRRSQAVCCHVRASFARTMNE